VWGRAFLDVMQEEGVDTWGIEMDYSAASITLKRHKVVNGSNLTSLDLPENYFDQITMFQVFEHVLNPLEMLENAFLLLKPKGRIIISVPNAESYIAQEFGRDWRGLEYPRHLFLYNPRAITNLLKRVGFQNIQYRTRFAPSDLLDSLQLRTSNKRIYNLLGSKTKRVVMNLLFPLILQSILFDSGKCSLLEVVAIKNQ
jgi:2-polyprenyl-3-methyl-5-hydroxy-6-metoxy-1,4-benzoquinol methylase